MTFKAAWRGVGRRVSVLVILAAAIGLAAPIFAGKWIALDLLSNFRAHFFGILAAGLLAFVATHHWLRVLVIGAVLTPIVIGLLPKVNGTTEAAIEPGEGETPFKLASFNMHHSNFDVPAIEAFLTESDADIMILVEVGNDKKEMLDRLASVFPYREDCMDQPYCNVVILSKISFIEGGHKNNWEGPPLVWIKFGRDLGNLTVVGTHLSRIPFVNRQWKQIRELARETLVLGDPLIVAGDFNATKWSYMLDAFQEFSGMWRLTEQPTWPTWFFGLPQLGIDHIFISNGIRPLTLPEVGAAHGSDHLPVMSQFSIPPADS